MQIIVAQLSMIRFLVLWLGLVAAFHAKAVHDPLFEKDSTISITLTGPFRQINRERDKEVVYRNAELAYTAEEGNVVSMPVELQARGNFRLQKDQCKRAPLRVLFNKDQATGTLFENQQKLKLVLLCRKQQAYRDYVIQEFLIYKIYNLLTDESFRVRLAEITYVEAGSLKSETSHGFFIEDQKRLAKRLGLKRIRGNRISSDLLDPEKISLVAMFQFLFGNTDWSVKKGEGDEDCCHNTKVLGKVGEAHTPVPYDFDYSGMVNAKYAIPQAALRLKSVRIRRYRGFCKADLVGMAPALARIEQMKDEIYALFEDNELLRGKKKRESINYLNSYFRITNSEKEFARKVSRRCRGRDTSK